MSMRQKNRVVLCLEPLETRLAPAQFSAIVATDPEPDGVPVFTGWGELGQMRMVTQRSVNGPDAGLEVRDLSFTLLRRNVAIDLESLALRNLADPTRKAPCEVTGSAGDEYFIACANLESSGVDVIVPTTGWQEYALGGLVTNPAISATVGSVLQLTLHADRIIWRDLGAGVTSIGASLSYDLVLMIRRQS